MAASSPSDLKEVTVTFTDNPEPFSTLKTVQALSAAIEGAKMLGMKFGYDESGVATGVEFITKVSSSPYFAVPWDSSVSFPFFDVKEY